MERKKQNNQWKTDRAVSGVIEALLLVALVATVISTIQLYYVPEIMKQREAEHMDDVSNQFSYLKSMIDIQTMTSSDAPIFSMLTLGNRDLPYFISVGASGEITIVNDPSFRIEIDFAPLTPPVYLTSITFEAFNIYFVPQTYSLEGGGIIVDQPDGESVMRVHPSISYTNASDVTIHFTLPIFRNVVGKDNTQGQGKCVIRTNYSGTETLALPLPINNNMRIYTNYLNAWNESLTTLLGTVADISRGDNYIEINQLAGGKELKLDLEKNYITVQIGPGWIV